VDGIDLMTFLIDIWKKAMHNNLTVVNNPTVRIGQKCIISEYTVDVPLNLFIKYLEGKPVRQVFRNLKKSDYEFLERGVAPHVVVNEVFEVDI
tara:strand:+ start:335 stop:613 length:279 start_codon:yes stop_codon:yes gene_type:complete